MQPRSNHSLLVAFVGRHIRGNVSLIRSRLRTHEAFISLSLIKGRRKRKPLCLPALEDPRRSRSDPPLDGTNAPSTTRLPPLFIRPRIIVPNRAPCTQKRLSNNPYHHRLNTNSPTTSRCANNRNRASLVAITADRHPNLTRPRRRRRRRQPVRIQLLLLLRRRRHRHPVVYVTVHSITVIFKRVNQSVVIRITTTTITSRAWSSPTMVLPNNNWRSLSTILTMVYCNAIPVIDAITTSVTLSPFFHCRHSNSSSSSKSAGSASCARRNANSKPPSPRRPLAPNLAHTIPIVLQLAVVATAAAASQKMMIPYCTNGMICFKRHPCQHPSPNKKRRGNRIRSSLI
jgi:hypothetical protein